MRHLAYLGWALSCLAVGCSAGDGDATGTPADSVETGGSGGEISTATGSGGSSGSAGTGIGQGGSMAGGSMAGAGGRASGMAGGAGKGGAGGSTAGSGGAAGMGMGGSAALTGPRGVWENVTPQGVDLKSDFGAQDVFADPQSPGVFYGFVCKQGVYKSTDWGVTWKHASTDGHLEQGRPWGEAMAPDGSYMLACTGYGPNVGAWKSSDGGATWTSHHIGGNDDPYMFDIDGSDKNHTISSTHSIDNIFESKDGGVTWTDRGSSGAGGSNYVFFLTSTTWLAISQDGSGTGTRRTTNSGGAWTKVGPMEHAHGNAQIFVDPNNGYVYAGGHNNGVFRSTDGGASFSQVSNIRASSVFATATRIYAMDPGANGGGTAPMPQSATRANGAAFAAFTVPATMTNGAKRAAAALDTTSGKWVIVSGNWNAGFWRFIEE